MIQPQPEASLRIPVDLKSTSAGLRLGINLPDNLPPEAIDPSLEGFRRDGFDAVELALDTLPLIVGGEINEKLVLFLKKVLERHPFSYSAHIAQDLDLRQREGFALHRQVLQASIKVCSLLGLNPLVLHYEKKSQDAAAERRFLEAHVEAAELASGLGIELSMENIEVERIEPVVEFVRKVSRPNLHLTLDLGHAFLAARYLGFDFLEAVKTARPVLGHVHLSDNTGVFEELRLTDRPAYEALPMGYRTTFGRGDIHLPPFWGKIPFREVFPLLQGYGGIFLCEYYSQRLLPFNKEIQERVRAELSAALKPLGRPAAGGGSSS